MESIKLLVFAVFSVVAFGAINVRVQAVSAAILQASNYHLATADSSQGEGGGLTGGVSHDYVEEGSNKADLQRQKFIHKLLDYALIAGLLIVFSCLVYSIVRGRNLRKKTKKIK